MRLTISTLVFNFATSSLVRSSAVRSTATSNHLNRHRLAVYLTRGLINADVIAKALRHFVVRRGPRATGRLVTSGSCPYALNFTRHQEIESLVRAAELDVCFERY
jgi:hypothetical protein